MDSNAINICVRVRPWHPEKELPFIIQPSSQPFFLGDGNFGCSPRKPPGGSLREVVEVMDSRQLDFDRPEAGSEFKKGQPGAKRYKDKRYIFDRVLKMDSTQEAVFERTAKPLLDGVLDGYNATVFAYGATGCGKTHTISGTQEDPGVTIRIMRELFERIEQSRDSCDTYLELSMIEIYNETIRDLLSDDFPACPRGGLKLLENEKERVRVDKVTLRRPESVEEVMELVQLGNQRRSTSSTASNSVSSRSHAVLQINVIRNTRANDVDLDAELLRQAVSSATLSIIDLAGSERAAATRNMGARMTEGANINKSLLALSSCISALCAAPTRKVHVPYRDSKLTRMLKFSLGGNCRTVMIVCVSPSSKDIEDTHNTLVWADRAKNVSTKISRNTSGVSVSVAQYLTTIIQQEQQIKILEAKLLSGPPEMSEYQKKKLEQAREDVRKAMEQLRGELDSSLPMIEQGATKRALWDASELQIAALERRVDAVDQEADGRSVHELALERRYLQYLIRQQADAYRGNPEVLAAVQVEASKTEVADKLLKNNETRTFGDGLEDSELEVVRLKVALHRSRVAKGVDSSREKGYRHVVQKQADDIALAAAHLHRLTTSVTAEIDRLSGCLAHVPADRELVLPSIDKLRKLASSSESALNSIFGVPSASSLPPPSLPGPSQHPSKLGNPSRRQSLAQPNPPSILKAAPGVRRVLTTAKVVGSPRRLGRAAASPRKPTLRPILVTQRDPAATGKRPLQWRDEAGKGEIDDSAIAPPPRVFTSSSSSSSLSPDTNQSSDTSGEWDDEEEGPPQAATLGKLPSALPFPIPRISLSQPALVPSMAPPVSAWKKNRILLGKSIGALGTLGEETAEQSSPEAGPSQPRFSTMPPPARSNLGPLSERLQLPQTTSSLFQPSTSSTLFKPTAASASRSTNSTSIFSIPKPSTAQSTSPSRRNSSVGRAQSSATKASRRSSNIGPYRRGRNSVLPQPVGSSSMDHSLSSASIVAIPFSLTPAPRLAPNPPDSDSGTEGGSRRTSVFGAPSGMPRPTAGPRASMSMTFGSSGSSTMPRGPAGGGMPTLHSRPSIAKLSTFGSVPGLAGAGDSSRAVWR